MRVTRILTVILTLFVLGVTVAFAVSPVRAQTTGLTIQGGKLLKDGQPFTVRGFSMEAAVTPKWCSAYPWGFTAKSHYGPAELNAYTSKWNANTLRFQVSQPGLASATSSQIAAYMREIKSEVAAAENAGMVVILAVQDQWPRSCGNQYQLPNAETVRAWKTLAAGFSSDPNVMFELFNEPEAGGSNAQWYQWAYGGSSPLANAGRTSTPTKAVGEQQLINKIRGWGADNVILVDGGNWAEWLTGLHNYPITDTGAGRGVGFAVHPYHFNVPGSHSADEAEWQAAYGWAVDAGMYVVATEWGYHGSDCQTDAPTIAPSFLNWLGSKGIGMTAFAGDVMHHTMADWEYDPTACGVTKVGGGGAQTQAWFTGQ